MIQKLFITQQYQENGTSELSTKLGLHGIYLCHDGEFVQVALDDQFPCSEQGGPIFSHAHGGELWVLFLEKAYAKLYGSYEKIEAGLAGHALRDLTGAPYEYFLREDDGTPQVDECWQWIFGYVQRNYVLAASSEPSKMGLEHEDAQGIIS